MLIDASVPRWSELAANGVDVPSAAFTPQAGDLLVLCVSADTGPADISISVSSSPALTWTQRAEADLGGSGLSGHASIWTATAASAVSTVVNVQRSLGAGGGERISAKLYLVNGAHATTPVGATVSGSSVVNATDTTQYVSTAAGSQAFFCGIDYANATGAISTDIYDAASYAFAFDAISGYKAAATPTVGTAVSVNLDAAGTGPAEWSYAVVEVIPAAGSGGISADVTIQQAAGTLSAAAALAIDGSLATTLGDMVLEATGASVIAADTAITQASSVVQSGATLGALAGIGADVAIVQADGVVSATAVLGALPGIGADVVIVQASQVLSADAVLGALPPLSADISIMQADGIVTAAAVITGMPVIGADVVITQANQMVTADAFLVPLVQISADIVIMQEDAIFSASLHLVDIQNFTPYCTAEDLINRFGDRELIQLTDRYQTGSIDFNVLNRAIADASAIIDSFLSGQYTLPLSTSVERLVAYCADIARYRLFDDAAPAVVEKRYMDAIHYLEKVSTGKIKLALVEPSSPPASGVIFESDSRRFCNRRERI